MKYTVGQFDVKSKDIKHNYLNMLALIEKAISDKFDVIVFGEYALVGYANADLFKSESFTSEVDYYTNKLLELSSEIAIIFGSIKKGKNLLVGASILYKNSIYFSAKNTLDKREFNEGRYFASGINKVITINNEDVLISFRSDYVNKDKYTYSHIIVLDSSTVNDIFESSEDNLIYANTIGISSVNKAVFINGGNSFIRFNNKVFAFDAPLSKGIIKKENRVSKISKLNALVKGIKVFSYENFGENKKWIVGNSGGLDSATTLALLTIALGSENVISYNLASKYNSQKTIKNAKHLANKLKVKHVEANIDHLVDSTIKTLNDSNYLEIDTLSLENIQARLRGHLLGSYSSLENAIISNNGNKLELALGYATMYGDTIGALSIIGDLVKVEVFELASEINHYFYDEVIPNNLLPDIINYKVYFDTAPSAELKENQKDPMKWFYHDLLLDLLLEYDREEILNMYLDNQFENLAISKWLRFYKLYNGKNFVDDFNYFSKTLEINQFKRLQTPPVLAYSHKVIGVDYLESSLLKPKSDKEIQLEKAIIDKYE